MVTQSGTKSVSSTLDMTSALATEGMQHKTNDTLKQPHTNRDHKRETPIMPPPLRHDEANDRSAKDKHRDQKVNVSRITAKQRKHPTSKKDSRRATAPPPALPRDGRPGHAPRIIIPPPPDKKRKRPAQGGQGVPDAPPIARGTMPKQGLAHEATHVANASHSDSTSGDHGRSLRDDAREHVNDVGCNVPGHSRNWLTQGLLSDLGSTRRELGKLACRETR